MGERVPVQQLRQNLSQYLRRVRGGESFEVIRRGRTVAMLVPATQASAERASLINRGLLVRPATRPLRSHAGDSASYAIGPTEALFEQRAQRE